MTKDARTLLDLYRNNRCSPEERRLVERYLDNRALENQVLPTDEELYRSVSDLHRTFHSQIGGKQVVARELQSDPSQSDNPLWVRRWAAAACIAVCCLIGGYYLYNNLGGGKIPDSQNPDEAVVQVLPGGNRAYITLVNGETLELREDQLGIKVDEKGFSYLDGSTVHLNNTNAGADSPELLKVTTPRGGTYDVVLSDGTLVKLNAGSSLYYPTRFDESSARSVKLEGEAYFDVKKSGDGHQSFEVYTRQQRIQVLGTKFNVTAYLDEPIVRTTLAEGAVRVKAVVVDDADSQVSELILKPGEQAISQGEGLSKAAVDVTNALAWTRGDIVFDELELETIVQQLERWYDVDFDRPEQELRGKLYGKIGRNTNLDEILRVMERNTRYTFKIYVTPTGERRVRVSK